MEQESLAYLVEVERVLVADCSAANACFTAATTDARNAGDGTSGPPAGCDESLTEEGGMGMSAFEEAEGLED